MSDSSDGKTFDTKITADAAGFLTAFQRATQGAQQHAQAINGAVNSIGAGFKAAMGPLVAFTAVLSGGKFLSDAVESVKKINGEAMGLAKSLGITGTEASALRTALGDIGADTDTYTEAFQKFAKQLRTNEDGLQAMGLKTRDANGHIRDSNTLFMEAVKLVGDYKPGLDQTTAAMDLFGKGVDQVMKLQRMNAQAMEDAKKKNKELGTTITEEGVGATKAYKAAMNDVGDVFEAIKFQIGQAVMPLLTHLGEWFSATGPTAVFVFKTGIGLVATAVHAVLLVLKELWNVLRAVADPLFTLGSAIRKLISGDLKGAQEDMTGLFKSWGKSLAAVGDTMVADAKRTWTEIENVWGQGTEVKPPNGGNKTRGVQPEKEDKSRMSVWEAALEGSKAAIAQQGALEGQFRERSLAENTDYWRRLSKAQDLTNGERVSLSRKVAESEMAEIRQGLEVKLAGLQAEGEAYRNNLEEKLRIERQVQAMYAEGSKGQEEAQKRIVAIQRQMVEQDKLVAQARVDAQRQSQLAGLAAEEQALLQYERLGVVSHAQVLQQQLQFEERRSAIARAALQDKLALAEKDPDRNKVELARIHGELEALEQQHQLRLQQIRQQLQVTGGKYAMGALDSVASSFDGIVQRIGTQIKTLNGLVRASLQGLQQAAMQALGKIAADWLRQELAIRIFGKATAVSKVAEQAAAAGAGGVASMAAAPFPLNLSAPDFGAAMAAAAMAFAPVASAAGGFDIPGTMNPIVQAHAREMILPQKYADVIRGLTDAQGGAAGAAGGPREVVVQAHPMPGNYFMAHRDQLVAAIKSAQRDNAWSPR